MHIDKLRAIAQAATPGPWEHIDPPQDGTIHRVRADGDLLRMEDTGYTPSSSWDQRSADAEHIATFDPVVVQAMLDVIDAADTVDATVGTDDESEWAAYQHLHKRLARFREVVP